MVRMSTMKTSMEEVAIFFLFSSLLSAQKICSAPLETITLAQPMKSDGDSIVSSGGSFEMGFFRPGNSPNRYVGIWYREISIRTVVWVANRQVPLPGTTPALLKLINPGILILLNGTNDTVWSSTAPKSARKFNPIGQLLDSGNFVVRDEKDDDPDNFLWQSFDYPSDTFLPGMKFGKNLVTGKEWSLSSWKSNEDPAPGDYTWSCDTRGYPQNILRKEGTVEVFRGGPWNGMRFSGGSGLSPNNIYIYKMVMNEQEVFFTYSLENSSIVSRFVLTPEGVLERLVWVERQTNWVLYLKLPKDNCDAYSLCGAYGCCSISSSPECGCLDKFVPKYRKDWERADWSKGCVRRTPLDCKNGSSDVFIKYSHVKLPDARYTRVNRSMNLEQCDAECSKNCSCMAYANSDVRQGGTGCLLWFNDLIDIRSYPDGGQDIFVRMASSELDLVVAQSSSKVKKAANIKVILPLVLLGTVLIGLSLALYVWKKKKNVQRKREGESRHESQQYNTNETKKEPLELPLFDFSTICNATGNFSLSNKLGEGGFGPVYKGVLEQGQEIAVKRLSRTSSQGIDEFKNEVICISKLRHRNLVKLLGFCIEGNEKLVIYEYMPNKSLDSFIFDNTQSKLLDWPRRFHIINGIARGLLYLHQDSRLRIIHRDLKVSNILLDLEMNPKISDFGIARTFRGNETEANTERVVGTYGYMSPEYAVDGLFSIKSDVFSFGVLVLEIVSGKRNRGFIHQDHHHNLLGHAWRLHNEGSALKLIDATIGELCNTLEVLRSVQVGLLCVQQSPEDRPNMSSVVLMLSGESSLPKPKQPGFFTERNILEAKSCSSSNPPTSISYEFTVTLTDGR